LGLSGGRIEDANRRCCEQQASVSDRFAKLPDINFVDHARDYGWGAMPLKSSAVIPEREQRGASPESITTNGVMDSGPAPKRAHPGMTVEFVGGPLLVFYRLPVKNVGWPAPTGSVKVVQLDVR
jgi:hypothetical protein